MKKLLIALFALLCLSGRARADVDSLGRGTATYTHDVSKGVYYTDSVRAPVTGITNMGVIPGGYTRYRMSVGTATGRFKVGDMVLVIQMKDASGGIFTGNHQNMFVESVAGSTIIAHTVISGGPLVPFATPGSPLNKVQMIRIDQYKDFTILSGEVSCHAWNDTTGGVLCFLVNNTLTAKGGIFNAAAKGYTPAEAVWGTGGAGAAGMTVVTATGYPAPLIPIGCPHRPAGVGSDGGAPNNTGGTGIGNSLSGAVFTPPTRNFHNRAVMGAAGYYPPGYGGGNGGGGGGKGGTGAANSCGLGGLPGANGADGQDGGDAGRGAAGGGILIIKAKTLLVSSVTTTYFTVRGQNGDNGRSGGNAGMGGDGGLGDAGSCIPFCDPGGPGGNGVAGDPGNGGDGGNGGSAGTAWVVASAVTAGISTATAINVKSGSGGLGGPGGYGWLGNRPYPVYFSDPCGDTCTPTTGPCTGVTIVRVCDKYRAFCHLGTATSAALHVPGNNGINNGYDFKIGSLLVAIYDIDRNELAGIDFDPANCTEIHYIATLYSVNDCSKIFKKLAFSVTGQTSTTGQVIDLSKSTDSGTCGLLPVPPTIYFRDKFGHDMFIYHGALDYIEDLSEPGHPRCYTGSCTPMDAISVGLPGRPGETPPDGSVVEPTQGNPSDPAANGIIQTPNPMWRHTNVGALNSDNGMTLYPNPVTDVLTIDVPSSEGIIEITDITGKTVYRESIKTNKLLVNVVQWANGVYFVKLYNSNMLVQTEKLVKTE
ncbi:T9SS type A sorting domain-containing protein [Chitinophagaceae bacterium MMS25-I14]